MCNFGLFFYDHKNVFVGFLHQVLFTREFFKVFRIALQFFHAGVVVDYFFPLMDFQSILFFDPGLVFMAIHQVVLIEKSHPYKECHKSNHIAVTH
jgi:hypothetical protein